MKNVIKLTESDILRLVKKVINERMYYDVSEDIDREPEDDYYKKGPNNVNDVVDEWIEKTNDSFWGDFIVKYPTKKSFNEVLVNHYLIYDVDDDDDLSELSDDDILDRYWNAESEVYMLEQEFPNFPGEDLWVDFFNNLVDAGW
jgi:hypothetical protein